MSFLNDAFGRLRDAWNDVLGSGEEDLSGDEEEVRARLEESEPTLDAATIGGAGLLEQQKEEEEPPPTATPTEVYQARDEEEEDTGGYRPEEGVMIDQATDARVAEQAEEEEEEPPPVEARLEGDGRDHGGGATMATPAEPPIPDPSVPVPEEPPEPDDEGDGDSSWTVYQAQDEEEEDTGGYTAGMADLDFGAGAAEAPEVDTSVSDWSVRDIELDAEPEHAVVAEPLLEEPVPTADPPDEAVPEAYELDTDELAEPSDPGVDEL